MIYQKEGFLTNSMCPLFYEVHDKLGGVDLEIDRVGMSPLEIYKLRGKMRKLSNQTPSNADIKLSLRNLQNGKFYGGLTICSHSLNYSKKLFGHDHNLLIKELFADAYRVVRNWRKARILAMD